MSGPTGRERVPDPEARHRALFESERRLSTLISHLPCMVYRCRCDADWTMEFVSAGSLAVTGYSPEELVHNRALSFADLIDPRDRGMVETTVQRQVTQGECFELEYRIRAADGSLRRVWERGCLVDPARSGVARLVGIIIDVTLPGAADDE